MSRARFLWACLMASGAVATPAFGQAIESDTPPVFQSVDENGVDQISGGLVQMMTSIGIGPGGPGSLRYNFANSNSGQTELFGFVQADKPTTGKYTVTIGGSSETFTLTGTLASGTFSQDQGLSSTLAWDAGTSRFTYTRSDSAVAVFGQVNPGGTASPPYLLSLVYPAGQTLTYYYRLIPATSGIPTANYQVRSVVSNQGYQLHYDYALAPSGTFYTQTGVVLFNRANEACDPTADTCTLTGNWPRLTFTIPSTTEVDATDNLSRLYRWSNTQTLPQYGNPGTAGTSTLIFPTGRTLTYAIDANGRVTSYNDGRGTWSYTHPNPYGGNTLTFYPEANGPPRQVNFEPATGQIQSAVTGGVTTTYTWASGRISSVAVSGGPSTHYGYDTRGNVTEVRRISATPGTPPDIVTSAVYPTTCTNPRACNQPTSTTDSAGNTTTYTYDSSTGAVLTVIRPAPATSAAQPETVTTYTAYQAYYLNNAGAVVASGSNISLPTMISSCATANAHGCVGTSDEVRTTISYGPQTAGTVNNLLPVSTTSGDGTGALAATTAMTYTADGDVETVDGPLAGSADTTRTYYDAARRPVGTISADPDGAGGNPRLATRTTYNDDNRPTIVEAGTATDQGATGMSTFSSLRQQVTAYDAQGRATSVRLTAGGTTYALSQSSTTLSGLPDCSVIRLNPATFASLPSACTLATAGSDGPDRISRIGYDWSRRLPVTLTTGVGATLEAVEGTTSYDALNRVTSLADGNNNLTSYEYDGLGREVKTRYPNPTTTGQSSTTDYEQVIYATATVGGATVSTPLVSSLRFRNGGTIGLSYDRLGRLMLKDLPNSDPDVAYTYDNLGRMTSALFSANGQGVTNTFDALGRLTSTSTNMGGTTRTLTYQYDLAGNRTRITHPDGNSFRTDYDGLNRPGWLYPNETTSIISLAYYAEGGPAGLSRLNGTYNLWYFDAIQRQSALRQVLGGTSANAFTTFGYNPAGQINAVTRDNDAYAFTGSLNLYNVGRAYTTNGLNQHTAAGSTTLAYDSDGNLITSTPSSGTADNYVYDSENRLVSASGAHAASLAYDPLGRLWQLTDNTTGAVTRFLYDGDSLVAEYNGTNAMTHRYVHWEGTDVPLASYVGNSLSQPFYLHVDERGSIVAISDHTGASVTINAYDEHGIPAAANVGRFQYTGQVWLPELGVYYYKARMYSPTLGRFMQTDPVGFRAGMNIYNYVGGDPVNLVDPTGLSQEWCGFVSRGTPGAHYGPQGDIIVTAAAMPVYWCGPAPGDVDLHDDILLASLHSFNMNASEEEYGRFDGNSVLVTGPASVTTCPLGSDSEVDQYHSPASFYQPGDDPIHSHAGHNPWIGPDDGVAAQGSGTAFMVSSSGAFRINHQPDGSYSVSLLAGHWGASPQMIRAIITNWNHFNGNSQPGGVTSAHGCQTHSLSAHPHH